MKHSAMRKLLSVIGCFVLIAAMALNFTGCANAQQPTTQTLSPEETVHSFALVVTDLEGNDSTFDITTTKSTVGDALLDKGMIAGTESEYGLYVTTVNGLTADWDADQTYWAFYIDGEYALTGVDQTEITDGATYSLVLTDGSTPAETEASGVSFTFVVTDLEGQDTTFPITTDKATVGEALLDAGLIEGSESEYGLYVTSVNGITADWDADQTYWAFYVDGEYALTGVDQTEVAEGATYAFVLTKG